MHFNDHDPQHFHARHQNQEVTVEIERGIVTGTMFERVSPPGSRMVGSAL
jgi:hypothetical protein